MSMVLEKPSEADDRNEGYHSGIDIRDHGAFIIYAAQVQEEAASFTKSERQFLDELDGELSEV